MLTCKSLEEFEKLILKHESIISKGLKLKRAKDLYFSDYWGEVKSLGAWGGDFVMITSDQDYELTREYFLSKGHEVFIPYKEMILNGPDKLSNLENERTPLH